MKKKSRLWIFLASILILSIWAFGKYQIHREKEILSAMPKFSKLEELSLIRARDSAPVGLDDIKGNIWVVDFFFSRCQGPCPLLSQKMEKLQRELASFEHIKLASITVDPENDTPEVLREYGKKFHCDENKWIFLTGEKQAIIRLAAHALKVPAGEQPDLHSTRFILIDSEGYVRGYYDSTDAQALKNLVRDASALTGSLANT